MGFLDYDGLKKVIDKFKNLLSGKQDELTPDESVTIEDDVIGVKNPVKGILTQEEYEKIPEDQRNKGTCFVLDDNDNKAMAAANVYSLEETICGRWIDGRPIYRRIIKTTMPVVTNDYNTYIGYKMKEINEAIRIIGMTDNGSTYVHIPYCPDSRAVILGYDIVEESLAIWGNYNGFTNKPLIVIFEYTKTTDKPTIEIPQFSSTLELKDSLFVSEKPTFPHITPDTQSIPTEQEVNEE